MSSSAARQTVIRLTTPAPRSVQVVNTPLRDDFVRAWTVMLLFGLGSTMAGFVAQSAAMGGLCFVVLALAGWRMWVRMTYDLSSRGIICTVIGRSRQIPWAQIADCEIRKGGLTLYPINGRLFNARVGGIYIRWNEQREAILEVVEFYMRQRVSIESTRTHRVERT